ncbi:DUF4157 domain-containing protein [Ascidiimonas aurantiaca]|uniref:eCIS core domain-containing protein n=1 Tax=Ascidiimonas aurantiaca TaxID=1685432 RepID=UPI0030EC3DAF
MDSRIAKMPENKSNSIALTVSQKQIGNASLLQFIDNRPESTLQRRLKEMADGSIQTGRVAQLQVLINGSHSRAKETVQRKDNRTGLPDRLKMGIESLSGYAMDDVKVHYNSNKPAQLNAHAYAQGTDIHIASGQEKHLPHEAWHVVQQKQGRVQATKQFKDKTYINDDAHLEAEADFMGNKAFHYNAVVQHQLSRTGLKENTKQLKTIAPIQLKPIPVAITGLTHLVKMVNGSIMEGKESIELSHGMPVTIDNENKYRSRRGPNQELYEHVDRKSEHNYRWFHVLAIGSQNVSHKNLFLRDETFVPVKDDEVVSTTPAKISNSHRLRDMNPQSFDFEGPQPHQKRNEEAVESLRSLTEKIIKDARESLAQSGNEGAVVREAIKEFAKMAGNTLGGTFISILYGSYATGSQRKATPEKPGSDIDAMFSCDNTTYTLYRSDLVPLISFFLKHLHDIVGATVDDEVPAESKHLIAANEMMKAASAKVFYPQGMDQKPTIHTLGFFLEKIIDMKSSSQTKTESERFGKDFLASEYLRLRLIFNILSSPNEVSSNNKDAVETLRATWLASLKKLSDDLLSMGGEKGESGVEHLLKDTHHEGKNDGEMFLGYKRERNGVIQHLISLLDEH